MNNRLDNKYINFIVPWYAADIGGGAETLCREFCQRLSSQKFKIRVLTTSCHSFQDNWNKNNLPEGKSYINGVEVIRFKVRPGNHKVFNDLNHKIILKFPLSKNEEEQFFKESINSDNLLEFIKNNCRDEILIFLPYLYGIIYYGIHIYPDNSILLPCLHDEGYAYLKRMKNIFNLPIGLIFNADDEMHLAKKLYGLGNKKYSVIGMGVEQKYKGNPKRFREQYNLNCPFLLYAGRKDNTKNVPFLIKLFNKYTDNSKEKIKLVLIGPDKIDIDSKYKNSIIDLGFVEPSIKADAYSAALALCQPSVNESFSITIMESWLESVPVIVNSYCNVTRSHCEKSNGGLYFKDYPEFKEITDLFIQNENIRKRLGINGKKYVEENYSWDVILHKFLNFLSEIF